MMLHTNNPRPPSDQAMRWHYAWAGLLLIVIVILGLLSWIGEAAL